MNRFLCVFAAAAVLFVVAAEGRAQFFDDFDGDALAPHWEPLWISPGSWDFEVAGGLLTIDSLNHPSGGGSNTNYQRLDTFIPPMFGDFTAVAIMGMTSGSSRSIGMRIAGIGLDPSQGGILGEMTYRDGFGFRIGGGGVVGVAWNLDPGLHEFKMIRSGSNVSYHVDDFLLGTQSIGQLDLGVFWIRLQFDVDYPGGLPMNPMMVDRVSVVPAPALGAVAITALSMVQFGRRRP
ncbi:MAG: hypothetical protein KF699_14600 [Phycisphaeraceae bacterium]|nr:hypothetical protein [Phycisphaeraceae bacterium]